MCHFCHNHGMTPALSAVPGMLAAFLAFPAARAFHAEPPPEASFDPGFLLLVVPFGAAFVWIQRRRHREAPLRREMRERPATFRSRVDVQLSFLGDWGSLRGIPLLTVRGEVFEVSDLFPPARWLLGMQYCYQAAETTMEAMPGRRHDWIEIAAQPPPGGEASRIPVLSSPVGAVVAGLVTSSLPRPPRIRIGRRGMTRDIWDALAGAGVHPIGAPPQ
jgi:hypothetical protein